jgi:serine/threonine-protein kinase
VASDAGIPFGSYSLLKRLARGGMAEVFVARQRHLEGYDRRVAVKRILPHLSDSADFVRMFLGEARLAARLTHPNIVHIYDFGKVADEYYIAMEYVDGVHCGQLIKHAKDEPLPPTLIARIGADAAAALHYAHQFADVDGKPLRLVHRDVSPPNLMVSFDGTVKLVDFGIAKAATVDSLTNPGTVKGKYAYMSPEQTTARTLDGRSDVFSLGLVMWELIAGRHIIERGNPVDVMRAIRDGKLPRIRDAVPSVPRELAHALDLALETNRDGRASALELSQILEAYIKAAPELATGLQLSTWIRGRFQPAATGMVAALPDAGAGTRVATAASSSGQSLVTPAHEDDHEGDHDHHGERDPDSRDDTLIDNGTLLGGKSSVTFDRGIGDTTVRTDPGPRPRRRGTTGPPPVPSPPPVTSSPLPGVRRTPPTPSQPPPFIARAAAAAAPSDLDDNETIARMPPPASRPTPPAPTPPPARLTEIPSVAPVAPVAFGTQTNQAALPVIERRDPTEVDPLPGHRATGSRRRALIAAVAGGICAAAIAIGLVLWHDDAGIKPAPPDASTVRVVPVIPVDAAVVTTELRVVTAPAGAVAQVGERRGQTPITFDLSPGTFVVRIEHAGYVSVARTVELAAGDHRILDLTLEPAPVVILPDAAPASSQSTRDKPRDKDRAPKTGGLTVTTTPYSNVYLGKRLLGQTPFADVEVPAGRQTFTFKHPGRRTVTRTIVITPGKTSKLKFALP